MSDNNNGSRDSKLSRRKFLLGSAATAAGAAVTVNSERANAFFNTFGFMKKPAGSGQTSNGYTIGQSLRFTSSAPAYMSRTPSVAPTSTQKFTFSIWLKRGNLASGIYTLLSGCDSPGGSYEEIFAFQMNSGSSDTLIWEVDGGGGAAGVAYTTALFRDPSAWYHIVLSVDTTQGTAVNRCRLFVNGVQNTDSTWTSKIPVSQNFNFRYLNANGYPNLIGARYYTNGGQPFDGYLAEIYMVDGQALDASSFGQIDSNTGQWIPTAYGDSYGTNGFYLKFADNSNTTAATLGKDSSPNGNHWIPTGFQTYDQVLDSPTNNFCTWNPIVPQYSGETAIYSNGNRSVTVTRDTTTSWTASACTTFGIPSSGSWIAELYCSALGSQAFVGLADAQPWSAGGQYAMLYSYGTASQNNTGATPTSSTLTWSAGDYLYIAVSGMNVWIGKKSGSTVTWCGGGSPSGGSSPTFTGFSPSRPVHFMVSQNSYSSSSSFTLEMDTAKFQITPPAGFKALCAANLLVPVVKKPAQHFDSLLYSGTGSLSRTISGISHAPDLVWVKSRTDADSHFLIDSVRGANKNLVTDQTISEFDPASFGSGGGLGTISGSGFTLIQGSSNADNVNALNHNYIAWCWKKGSAPGFDIVTFTGDDTTNRSINHSLGAVPKFVLIKGRTGGVTDWHAYHVGLTNSTYFMFLNTPAAQGNTASPWGTGNWSTTQFMVSKTIENVNTNGYSYIAYLWAEVAGFSKFGSYTGNGSADGPFVYCGFKPRWVLTKRIDSAESWAIFDSARDSYNSAYRLLWPNMSSSEYTTVTKQLDFLSNGFKQRNAGNGTGNVNGATYIFAAFAEAPFKYSNAR